MTDTLEIDPEHPCEGCPILSKRLKSRAKVRKKASFLIVGKQPSHDSLKDGRIIPPKAHETLMYSLDKADLLPTDFSWANSVRCEYDETKYPAKVRKEIEKRCRHHLLKVIEAAKPEVIVPLGAVAAKQVYGRAVKITKVKGVVNFSEELQTYIMAMTDPVQVNQYPQALPMLRSDADALFRAWDHRYDKQSIEEDTLGEYELIDDLQFLIDEDPEFLAFDVETQGLRPHVAHCKLLTLQFCPEPGRAYMMSWDHPDAPMGYRKRRRIKEQLRQLLCSPRRKLIGQNLKYDGAWAMRRLGIHFKIHDDTLMLAATHDENLQSKDLDTLTKIFVPEMAGYADQFNAEFDKSQMEKVPLNRLVGYGCGDVDASYRVWQAILPLVQKDERMYRGYRYVSIAGINAFLSFETDGMLIDEPAFDEFERVLGQQVDEEYQSLIAQVPREIKRLHAEKGLAFTRADFVRDILFLHKKGFRLRPKVFTKSTQNLEPQYRVPSISTKDHLPYFYDECPFAEELSEYIKNNRILGTNVKRFRENYLHKSRIYPIYQLWVAVTGRTSCLREDQLVDVRGGKKRADAISVGDEAFTHRGRFRQVTKLFRKPVTDMVDITLGNGEVLHVTYDHIVLLNDGKFANVRSLIKAGIDYAERIEEAYGGRQAVQASSERVQNFYEDRSAGGRPVLRESRYGKSDDSTAYLRRRLQEIRALQVPREQAGGKEPTVWEAMGLRLRGWEGLPYETSQGHALPCPQDSDGGNARHVSGSTTYEHGGTSHRRGRDEQSPRQFSTDERCGSRSNAPEVPLPFREVSIESIEHSGSYRVYDFEVDEDRSYLAGGVFNHNSRDPNGQNFPKRGAAAKAYRKIFIPPPGYVQLEADLSQAELRIAADMANDKVMLEIYNNDGDIHTMTACIVKGIKMTQFYAMSEEDQGIARFKAKAVNFGFLYGMWWKAFVGYAKTQYGVTFKPKEAENIRKRFFQTYSRLEPWHRGMKAFVKEHGFVRSYDGRIRHLPTVYSDTEYIQKEAERQAVNSPVQEFASSLGVMAMSRITTQIDQQYLKLTGFVHDALYAITPECYVEWGAKTLKHYMETVPIEEWFGRKMKVQMKADVGFGMNGADVHEMKALDLNQAYDFSPHAEKMDFELPDQLVPPDNGRFILPEHLQCEEQIHLWT